MCFVTYVSAVDSGAVCCVRCTGFIVIPKCPADWCFVRHMGSQAISPADSDFHMCANSTDEVQSLVSSMECHQR